MLHLRRLVYCIFFLVSRVLLMLFCMLSLGYLVLIVANEGTFWNIEI